MDPMPLMESLISSIIASGAVSVAVLFLFRTWIAERLRQSISHEYAQKLEAHRAALKSEYDTQIERLRAENARQLAIEAAAGASVAHAQRALHEKQLAATETAWRTLLAIRDASSSAMIYLDILTDSELQELPRDNRVRTRIDAAALDRAVDRMVEVGKGIDDIRPFVGDEIYAILHVYRAMSGRVELLLRRSLDSDRFDPWWLDSGIQAQLKIVLDQEDIRRIQNTPVARFGYARSVLEQRLLGKMQQLTSGASAARFSVETASAIADAARKVAES